MVKSFINFLIVLIIFSCSDKPDDSVIKSFISGKSPDLSLIINRDDFQNKEVPFEPFTDKKFPSKEKRTLFESLKIIENEKFVAFDFSYSKINILRKGTIQADGSIPIEVEIEGEIIVKSSKRKYLFTGVSQYQIYREPKFNDWVIMD